MKLQLKGRYFDGVEEKLFDTPTYKWEVLPQALYSPYMSPPDLDLFPKLKEPMRRHHFSSLEEVSAAPTQAIRGLNKSGTLNGIENLPKHWDVVTEKQGDYIEGL
jgi:hypothetical protein